MIGVGDTEREWKQHLTTRYRSVEVAADIRRGGGLLHLSRKKEKRPIGRRTLAGETIVAIVVLPYLEMTEGNGDERLSVAVFDHRLDSAQERALDRGVLVEETMIM